MHFDSHIVLTCKLKIDIILEKIAGYLVCWKLQCISKSLFKIKYCYTGFWVVLKQNYIMLETLEIQSVFSMMLIPTIFYRAIVKLYVE